MVEIMTEMHKYVPTKLYEEEYFDEDEDEVIRLSRASIHPILIGGDQLTACRARQKRQRSIHLKQSHVWMVSYLLPRIGMLD